MRLGHARAWIPRVLLAIAAAGCVALLTWRGTTARLDSWVYDHLLPGVEQSVDDRVVLVVVDEKSLAALGRWPWPRDVHAALLRTLTAADPHGVGFDVMFAEPAAGDTGGDAALAQAIAASGRTVLPVAAEAAAPGAPPVEVLPMPPLTAAAAALGHAEIDLDPDGIARQAFLHAGLGSAHWPSLALALHDLGPDPLRGGALPGARAGAAAGAGSPYLWHRDHRVMVPFARGEGFQQVAYVDALRGHVPASAFRDRWVLVGVTASGLAREVMVPGAARGDRIAGVEYHAHVLNALLQRNAIVPLGLPLQLALGMVLAMLPFALQHPRHRFRRGWAAVAAALLLAVASCLLLLHHGRVWFAPMPVVLVLCAGYIALLLPGLRRSQRLARSDGLTRLANRHMFDLTLERELGSARRSRRPLSLLLIDVDHFKPYNDHYGHQAGDAVLQKVADIMLSCARRPRDVASRYGGDELALILPGSAAQAAAGIARTILDEVRALDLPHVRSPTAPRITLSIGVATCDPAGDGMDVDLLGRADAALYQAKRAGRDRIHVASWPTERLAPPPRDGQAA
jgi:diguanylate cyclase (GGDEF)-like protein